MVGDDISLVHNNQIVTDDYQLTEIINDHYIDIVEKTSGQKPCNIADTVETDDDRQLVRLILDKYKDHPSAHAIREGSDISNSLSFHEIQHHEVWALLRSLDGKNLPVKMKFRQKLVHLAANELTVPLTCAINGCLQNHRFPDRGKRAAVCPLEKGEVNRTVEKNFRPTIHIERCGVSGQLLSFIRSFLKDRTQRTVLNGKSSVWGDISAGVPQGSILGPSILGLNAVDWLKCHLV